jgi:hypothetical protein
MPGFDRRGPVGQGPNTGRGAGNCSGRARDGLSIVIARFVLDNWRPIVGFLATTLIPLIRRKMLSSGQVKVEHIEPAEQADPVKQIEDKSGSN